MADLSEAVGLDPKNGVSCSNLAWFLATSPDTRLRDAGRAVKLAKIAIEHSSAHYPGDLWNTLGVAQYRVGNWLAAVQALERATQLRSNPHGADGFFLGMAHWQLGNKDRAREFYGMAVAWMEKN